MATMKDVAQEAGVAVGTVSKYINNLPIGDDYRIRIEHAIKKLNYSVNTYARGLKTSKTDTVAVIVPDVRNLFFANFVYYVESALFQRNLKMFLCSSNEDRSHVIDYINMAKQNKVEGIIAITYSDIDDVVTDDVPFVSIDRHFSAHVPCIASDNYGGGRMAAEKLIACGCTKPFFLRSGSHFYGETNKRWDGFAYGCRLLGFEPKKLDCGESDHHLKDEFTAFVQNGLARGDLGFDGLFAVTDLFASMAIRILNDLGVMVPRDVQVIGFDGMRHFNVEHLPYVVSTFKQPIKDMADRSVDMLLDRNQVGSNTITLLPVEYCYGGTTLE